MIMKLVSGLLAVVLTAPAFAAVACGPKPLRAGEVSDYKGEKLSSVDDFRENSIKGPQHIDINTYRLSVNGLVSNPKELTYEDVINKHQQYQKVVTLNCVEGWSVTILWEGVLLSDLLKEAGARPEGNTIIFHAYDGYTSSLPVDYVVDNNILLAYKMNDIDIPPERGYPFMVVAESKWGYKWVKWVTAIEVSDNTSYKGFWELRGYSDSGDLDKHY